MEGHEDSNIGDNEFEGNLLDDDMDENNEDSKKDIEDEQEIELPEEDELPENHHKMAAFQIAIRTVLQRQICTL